MKLINKFLYGNNYEFTVFAHSLLKQLDNSSYENPLKPEHILKKPSDNCYNYTIKRLFKEKYIDYIAQGTKLGFFITYQGQILNNSGGYKIKEIFRRIKSLVSSASSIK